MTLEQALANLAANKASGAVAWAEQQAYRRENRRPLRASVATLTSCQKVERSAQPLTHSERAKAEQCQLLARLREGCR